MQVPTFRESLRPVPQPNTPKATSSPLPSTATKQLQSFPGGCSLSTPHVHNSCEAGRETTGACGDLPAAQVSCGSTNILLTNITCLSQDWVQSSARDSGHVRCHCEFLLPHRRQMVSPDAVVDDRAIVEAAISGNLTNLKALLLAGGSSSARHSADAKSMTALHAAVVGGSEECCRVLLEHGADVHSECLMLGSGMHTPSEQTGNCLFEACGLVSCHDSVDYFCLWQPLHEAAARGLDGICELLIAAGARAGRGELRCRITPLHCAAANGHVSTVRLLLAHGASALACARSRLDSSLPMGDEDVFDGWTPLHFAVACCRHDVAHVLLLCGADLSARATTLRWSADAAEMAEWSGGWGGASLTVTAERAASRRTLMLWRCSLQWGRGPV